MNTKPQLVLDIGGVLLANLSPLFWQELTSDTVITHAELTSRYKAQMSEALWRGAITEEQFWHWICEQCSSIDGGHARALLRSKLTPLPALNLLPEWSRIADIHLLSNHRMEWIMPCLASVEPFIQSMTISSQVGVSKPHAPIYRHAASELRPSQRVLFVDDLETNLLEASRLGWDTLLADEQGAWLHKVIPLLTK
ncbi:HAD-IA family hydrolase [Paenibacillus oenotherae]|uniref:HAD-IA family hydrolase n=1 Tax=Paenibacillus oenotherae TaxID=1435645 RepID=A0ABS7DAE4_9BACL|nr:HAD-IA family hydrolase [Paenibacillus oenotherae]MBW7476912.1 HAD-IA family hydrolase [Paenibacillus oenotherae]